MHKREKDKFRTFGIRTHDLRITGPENNRSANKTIDVPVGETCM